MFKQLRWLLVVFLPFNVCADPEGDVSDECLRSMQDLYKFYYHEIQPNPKSAPPHEKLSSADALQMQVVIGELKKHCSSNVIARINDNLKGGNHEPNTASG